MDGMRPADMRLEVGDKLRCTYAPFDWWTEGNVYEVIRENITGELRIRANDADMIDVNTTTAEFILLFAELEHTADIEAETARMSNLDPEPDDDIIKQPAHYTRWTIEPIKFITENGLEFWRGNIIKYAMRAGFKHYDGYDDVESEIRDLEKIREYADIRIRDLKGEDITR